MFHLYRTSLTARATAAQHGIVFIGRDVERDARMNVQSSSVQFSSALKNANTGRTFDFPTD